MSLQNKEGSTLVGGWILTEVAEFLQQYRNDSFSPHSPSLNHEKKKFTFHIFPGICDFTRSALYTLVMKGNPVQWDKVILGITFNEIKSYNWTGFGITSPQDVGGCCSHVFVGSLDLLVFLV